MELEKLMNSLDFENNRYFYHITGQGFGDEIIEEGLALEERDLRTTTIEIPKEMIDNPIEYCESEYSDTLVKRQEMVIIGCEKGQVAYIIEQSDIPRWVGDQKLDYIIPNEYILGYIDLKTLEITYNSEYWCKIENNYYILLEIK